MGKHILTLIFILIGIMLISGCSKAPGSPTKTIVVEKPKQTATQGLNDYYSTMDYSCEQESDCRILDVHNCCGQYLQCVNKNARTDAAMVEKLCKAEGAASICGFEEVTACKCSNSRCTKA